MLTSTSFRCFKVEWDVSEYMFISQKSSLLLKKETRRMSLWSIMSLRIENERKSLMLM